MLLELSSDESDVTDILLSIFSVGNCSSGIPSFASCIFWYVSCIAFITSVGTVVPSPIPSTKYSKYSLLSVSVKIIAEDTSPFLTFSCTCSLVLVLSISTSYPSSKN